MKSAIFKALIFCLLCLAVVVPNSLQLATAGFLVASFLMSLLFFNPLKRIAQVIRFWGLGAAVTIVYILVGQLRSAPVEAAIQTVLIYLISPILWLCVSGAMLYKIGEEKLTRWFVFLAFACIGSVALYFYLFINGGPDAVSFFIEEANLNLEDGYAGATMFVYGSLIFLTSGFFAESTIVKNVLLRAVLLAGLTVVAITSGRSALILSVPVGLAIGIFARPYQVASMRRSFSKRVLSSPIFYALTSFSLCLVVATATGVDVFLILDRFLNEVGSAGGSERANQMLALLEGVGSNLGTGAGHGIGVSLVRSDTFPWRYEAVWIATLFRVGLIGALIYALPFFIYIKNYFWLKKRDALGPFDLFLFAGFMSAFVASNTNPYIEAFSFQWMLAIPLASLTMKRAIYRQLQYQQAENLVPA